MRPMMLEATLPPRQQASTSLLGSYRTAVSTHAVRESKPLSRLSEDEDRHSRSSGTPILLDESDVDPVQAPTPTFAMPVRLSRRVQKHHPYIPPVPPTRRPLPNNIPSYYTFLPEIRAHPRDPKKSKLVGLVPEQSQGTLWDFLAAVDDDNASSDEDESAPTPKALASTSRRKPATSKSERLSFANLKSREEVLQGNILQDSHIGLRRDQHLDLSAPAYRPNLPPLPDPPASVGFPVLQQKLLKDTLAKQAARQPPAVVPEQATPKIKISSSQVLTVTRGTTHSSRATAARKEEVAPKLVLKISRRTSGKHVVQEETPKKMSSSSVEKWE